MMSNGPTLSVIIASTDPLRGVPPSLESVVRQRDDHDLEIVLALSSDTGFPDEIARRYPDVELLGLPGTTRLPRLLGIAIGRARGTIIALTDVTSVVDERWVEEIVKAHAAPYPVIGGAVEPNGLKRLVDWAAYFCEYAQFMRPAAEGATTEVPGNNLSFKRSALAIEAARTFTDQEFWKTYWCRRLQAAGLRLYSVPSIVVYYRKSFRLGPFLVRRFHHGRCFAGMRLAQLSPVSRACYITAAPCLPILFTARILKVVLGKQRHLTEFALSFPISCLAILAWSLGEWVGYILGPGTSCDHVR